MSGYHSHISSNYRSNYFNTAEHGLVHKYLHIKEKNKNDFISKILTSDKFEYIFENFNPILKIQMLQTIINKDFPIYEDLYRKSYNYYNLVYLIFNGYGIIEEGYAISDLKKTFVLRNNIRLLEHIARKKFNINDKNFINKFLKDKTKYVNENGTTFATIFAYINDNLKNFRSKLLDMQACNKTYRFLLDKYQFDAIDTEMVKVERKNFNPLTSYIPDKMRNSSIAKITDKCQSIRDKIDIMDSNINSIREEIDYTFYVYRLFRKDNKSVEFMRAKFDVICDNQNMEFFNIKEDGSLEFDPKTNPYLNKDYGYINYYTRLINYKTNRI